MNGTCHIILLKANLNLIYIGQRNDQTTAINNVIRMTFTFNICDTDAYIDVMHSEVWLSVLVSKLVTVFLNIITLTNLYLVGTKQ